MIISKKLETAAIGVGVIVKQGTAANGATLAGVGDQGLGVVIGSADNETMAVGDHIDIAFAGVQKVLLGAAVSAGDNLCITANGLVVKMANVTVGGVTITGTTVLAINRYRVGVAKTNGVASDLIEAAITNDFVFQTSVT